MRGYRQHRGGDGWRIKVYSWLRRGGGVCGARFRAAGKGLDRACATIGWCGPGDAVATPGVNLPAPWIIHTVGPVWAGGEDGEPAVRASCYRRVIEVATEIGAASVAIPAISTGIFGCPAGPAAAVAGATLRAIETSVLDEAILVAVDDDMARRYRDLITPGPDRHYPG